MTYKLLRTALLTLHGSRITLSHPYISYFVLRISCCVPTGKLPPNPQHPTLNAPPYPCTARTHSRCPTYQSTVRRRPASNETSGAHPSSLSILLASMA